MLKMNYWFSGLLLFVSMLCSCQPSKGGGKLLSVDEFDVLLQNEEVQRLDVRTTAEYSEGHIQGAFNINVLDESFAAMADSTLQKGKPVALYCRSGKRSKKAAAILNAKGYDVYELDKGFNAWQSAGKKIDIAGN